MYSYILFYITSLNDPDQTKKKYTGIMIENVKLVTVDCNY